jgi:hypothetical protein
VRDPVQLRLGQKVRLAPGHDATLVDKSMNGPAVVWHQFAIPGVRERLFLTKSEVLANLLGTKQ